MDALASNVWPLTAERLDDGALAIGGCDLRALAVEYGTPLYVVDEADMRTRAREFREAFTAAFAERGAGVDVYYAGKAFLCSKVASWMIEEGLGIDVASGGELEIALRGGAPASRLTLHGNNKSDAEIERGLEVGVGRVVVDSLTEIEVLAEAASARKTVVPVLVRVATGVHAGGHESIATAHEDQKFGLSLSSGAALEAMRRCHAAPSLRLLGIHTHLGSQVNDLDAFRESVTRLLGLRAAFAAETGEECPELDLGGGFPVPYLPKDSTLDVADVADGIAGAMSEVLAASGGTWPHLSIEPGRSIAARAGVTVYTVGVTKTARPADGGERRYVAVDGGMSDNMRPVTYGAEYTATLASRESAADSVRSRVVGKHCETGDILVRDVDLPGDLGRGDLLAVAVTGAYGRSMANNYNALMRPAVVAVRDGESDLLVRRDTVEDLLAWDVAP